MTIVAKKIHDHLKQAKDVLIVSHKNPDGDTLASASALMQYLRQLNIKHTAFCATPISQNLAFLPHLEYFITDSALLHQRRFDTVIVVDAGDLLYAGVQEYFQKLAYSPVIINIDHHRTNELYGHHNLVLPDAASTTEVLHFYFKINNIKLDKHLATCLLTGIVTDTNNFSNPATTARSLKTASELLRAGANLRLIQGWTLKNKTLGGLKIWGKVLSRLQKNNEYDVVSTVLIPEDIADNKKDVSNEEVEGLSNFLNNLGEGKIVLLLKDKGDGIIKASLRTTDPLTDVSILAQYFGGGGHAKAAGFSIPGKILQTATGWQVI
jgi:phosphoesterase RecJ-like protein